MSETSFRNRRAVQIENDEVRVTVLAEGGHIAEILHKASGVNPLWIPPWPSSEPSAFDPAKITAYGNGPESKLLAGIMGHNVCIDLFGGPSDEEAASGITVHGEASVLPYEITAAEGALQCSCHLPHSQLSFRRLLHLDGSRVRITESVENLGSWDRPIAWQQHVSIGPPFLQHGGTRIETSVVRSQTYDGEFGDLFPQAVPFQWPHAPLRDGGIYDLSLFTDRPVSAGYTAHLAETSSETAFFRVTSAHSGVAFGYQWRRADFPWLGLWEENCARQVPPWNGVTVALGLEFGVSPQPEPRRAMIQRGTLFGVPAYRWIPARAVVSVSYEAFIEGV